MYKARMSLWQLRKAIAAAILMAVTTPAMAAPQEYTIMAVGVDVSHTKAEVLAMEYAKARALYMSATKMGVKNAETRILQLAPDQLTQAIRGATVDKTKREGTTTYQLIRVTVAEDRFRAMMGVAAAPDPSSEQPAKSHSILLIPALVGEDRMFVWEKENTLRPQISDEVLRQSRGIIMLAGGDLQDLRLIDKENATKVTSDELKPMFERYGADEIIIASASTSQEDTTDLTHILLHRVTTKEVRNEVIDLPPETKGDSKDMRLKAAAKTIVAATVQIASSTAENDRAKLDNATKIPISFIYNTPRDLARMSAIIRKAPSVLQLEMPSIALGDVKGRIYLEGGDKTALHTYLAARGLVVREKQDGWSVASR